MMLLMIIMTVAFLAAVWIADRACWQVPVLFYKSSTFTNYIINEVARLSSPYKATCWLSHNRHIHTIIASMLREFTKIQISRQYLKLQDGGIIALDWLIQSKDDRCDDRPILIVVSGIQGDIKMTSFVCKRASQRGYRTVIFNKRGHGDSHLTTPKLQSFGDPHDFKQVVEYVHKSNPYSKLLCVTFSSGGGLLMSYLGEEGNKSLLTACVFISPGFSPLEQIRRINWFYEMAIVQGLKKIVYKHSEIVSSHLNMDAVQGVTSMLEFDEQVYCKFYNHSNVEEYWNDNDPMRNHTNVAVPVLFLSSLDDPVLFAEFIPYDVISEHSDWILVRVDKGGHCGFREGISANPWAECVALEYLDAVLKYETK